MKISFVELENYYPIKIAKWLENAFRRFESVYRPEMDEMHLQNSEKLYNKNAFRPSEKLPYFFTIHYYL